FNQVPAILRRQPGAHLGPDALIRPIARLGAGLALEIQALNGRGARADQCKTAFVMRIDNLLRRGRRLDQQTEPGEGITSLQGGMGSRWNGWPTDAVAAVATGDEIAA